MQIMKLTKRELEILTHVMQGKQSREVADILFLSKRTVDFHLSNIYTKLDVTNRVQAFHKASKLGLLAEETIQPLYYR
ncbi:MAG: ATP-dependent transcriptional regulator, MalT-like, LuxR family [Capsulimonas sp.]|jgi:DNA-binding CsgD family transcriptional regulator|nr:ATP-dependent transcriptional regulator, MalT-like, LuxR family [Capsulimonas sp.]